MNKTAFPLLGACAVVAAWSVCAAPVPAMDDAEWAQRKSDALNRQRRLIYDNDSDDAMAWPRDLSPTLENYLAQRTSYLKGSKVDTLVYAATWGAFTNMLMPSPFGSEVRGLKESPIIQKFRAEKTDPVQVQLRFARENNLEFFASIRINDTHDAAGGEKLAIWPRYKSEHPEFLFGSSTSRPLYGDWSSFDFDREEIRRRFIDVTGFVMENYELDGLLIDFFRQFNLFATVGRGAHATPAQREKIIGMMREIRARAEACGRRRGRPILLAVRIPDSVEYCRAGGLDLKRLLDEKLVDIVIAAGNFRMNQWSYSAELCHKYGVKCYASVEMPQYNEAPGRLYRNGDISHYAVIAQALTAGVDGTYWFNRFYRHAVERLMVPDLAGLKLLSKRYFVTDRHMNTSPEAHLRGGDRFNNLPLIHPLAPVELRNGKTKKFILEFGDDLDALKAEGGEFEIAALLKGRLPNPRALRIESNGVVWPFRGMEDGLYAFDVPEGALKPGSNTLAITDTAKTGSGNNETVILSGKHLLQGDNQPPWRRLFPAPSGAGSESIVAGAYRFADTGKGYANFLYPLPEISGAFKLKGSIRVDSATGSLGAVLRVADGRYAEIFSFRPEGITCLLSGEKIAFKPGRTFHDYEITFDGGEIVIDADGREIGRCRRPVSVDDPRAALTGFELAIPAMNERSILIGSLDDAGEGVSFWKNLRINHRPGDVRLEDFGVEVNISRPLRLAAVKSWGFKSDSGAPLVTGAKPSWDDSPMVAEIDVDMAKTPARIAVSCGGSFGVLDISSREIAFPNGGRGSLPWKNAPEKRTIRIQFDGTPRAQFFCGGQAKEFEVKNVTMALADPAMAGLTPLERAALRQSGVVVLPGADGRRAADAVLGIRAAIGPDAGIDAGSGK